MVLFLIALTLLTFSGSSTLRFLMFLYCSIVYTMSIILTCTQVMQVIDDTDQAIPELKDKLQDGPYPLGQWLCSIYVTALLGFFLIVGNLASPYPWCVVYYTGMIVFILLGFTYERHEE
jgi:hypothetical protein